MDEKCHVCGCKMCYVYQCDPFYEGCGFVCKTCDLPEDCEDICPNCNKALDVKLYCYHPHYGGCGHIKKLELVAR